MNWNPASFLTKTAIVEHEFRKGSSKYLPFLQTVVSKRKDVFASCDTNGMLECEWKSFVKSTKKVNLKQAKYLL